MKEHMFNITIQWTGNDGEGTKEYRSYNRDHTISNNLKYAAIKGSSAPSFLGDKTKYNPEELLLSSISSCHMLWYLHLCTTNQIVVTDYIDHATGVMQETENGSGKFEKVTLHPKVRITDASMIEKANDLHSEANKMCFIANSCNFKIYHRPLTTDDHFN